MALTNQGRSDAREMAKWLAEHEKVDWASARCFRSASVQVIETCDIIEDEFGANFKEVEDLRHIYLGVLDGLTTEEARKNFPHESRQIELWNTGSAEIGGSVIPGQEAIDVFYERVRRFVVAVANGGEKDTVVVATRSIGIAVANVLKAGLDMEFDQATYKRYLLDPTSVSSFLLGGIGDTVRYWNYSGFLGEGLRSADDV